MRLKRAKTAPGSLTSIPCFSTVHFRLLHFYEGPMSVPVFDDREIKNLKTISGLIKKAKTLNSVQCTVLQREASHSPSRETGPTERLPWKPHPTSQHQVATALNPVWEHLCFTCTYLFYVLTSRMCPRYLLLCFMLLWLMKGFLGVLCFQIVGKPGLGTAGVICPFHSPDPSVRSLYYF